jgi:hypothetical protein
MMKGSNPSAVNCEAIVLEGCIVGEAVELLCFQEDDPGFGLYGFGFKAEGYGCKVCGSMCVALD